MRYLGSVTCDRAIPQKGAPSVTIEKDDNPEGINQYTGGGGSQEKANKATANAKQMSQKAAGSQSATAHNMAGVAHFRAMQAHRQAEEHAGAEGNKGMVGMHQRAQGEHMKEMKFHDTMSKRAAQSAHR